MFRLNIEIHNSHSQFNVLQTQSHRYYGQLQAKNAQFGATLCSRHL
jgi:hypothetical protein